MRVYLGIEICSNSLPCAGGFFFEITRERNWPFLKTFLAHFKMCPAVLFWLKRFAVSSAVYVSLHPRPCHWNGFQGHGGFRCESFVRRGGKSWVGVSYYRKPLPDVVMVISHLNVESPGQFEWMSLKLCTFFFFFFWDLDLPKMLLNNCLFFCVVSISHINEFHRHFSGKLRWLRKSHYFCESLLGETILLFPKRKVKEVFYVCNPAPMCSSLRKVCFFFNKKGEEGQILVQSSHHCMVCSTHLYTMRNDHPGTFKILQFLLEFKIHEKPFVSVCLIIIFKMIRAIIKFWQIRQ